MRRHITKTIIAGCFLLMPQFVKGQNPGIPAPEFNNQVMAIAANNTLSNLDKTELFPDTKIGLGTAKAYYRADGCCAKVAMSGAPNERYIVKVGAGIDPASIVELYEFDEGKKSRKLLNKSVGSGARNHSEMVQIQLVFKKVADGVYGISHKEQLPEGEYIFIINSGANTQSLQMTMPKAFCFSVGGK